MTGWVVVVVPDGLLTAVTPPKVFGDRDGRPFATPDAAQRVAALFTYGAYVAELEAGA